MLLGAAFLSRLNGKIFDFYFILALYFVNYSIQKWQEFKADRAIAELQSKLSFNVSTLRDGQWNFVNAKYLVPGDHGLSICHQLWSEIVPRIGTAGPTIRAPTAE